MADNTVTASGPTRGASYVLPWDAMAQYDQMVQTSKNQYEQQNQQRLATIADMEKQDLTGMPSYDKALEDHYEKLHGEMGKIITKYRDPFQSLEGMRELKNVQAKYIANPIVNNAKTTETSFKSMQADLANNIITKEDYDIRKAEYDKHITEGDVTKPFVYQQPNYIDPTTVVAQIASSFEKKRIEDGNSVTTGYTDEQIGHMYDTAFIDKSRDRFMLGVENYARAKGKGPITDEKERKRIGEEYIRMMLPPVKVNKEKSGNGDGSSNSSVFKLRTFMDANLGHLNPNDAKNYIKRNSDGSLATNLIGFGIGNETYTYDTKGKYIHLNGDRYDPDTKQFNSELLSTKAQVTNDIGDKISKAARDAGVNGKIFLGSDNTESLTPEQFFAIGTKLGFNNEKITELSNLYVKGYTNNLSQGLMYGSTKLDPKGGENGLSANAFLVHILNKIASSVEETEIFKTDDDALVYDVFNTRNKSLMVRLHGVQVDSNVSMAGGYKTNTDNATGSASERQGWSEIQVETNTPDYDTIGGGIVYAKTNDGRYDGFTDMITKERLGGDFGTPGNSGSFADVFLSPRISDAAYSHWQSQNRVENRYKNVGIENKETTLPIKLFFKGLTDDQIKKQMLTPGQKGLSFYQMASEIQKRIDDPEYKKRKEAAMNSGEFFKETLSLKEQFILDMGKQYGLMTAMASGLLDI